MPMERGTSRRLVEGLGASMEDVAGHCIHITQDVRGFDPHNMNILGHKPSIPPLVMRDLCSMVMPASINLDR